MQMGKPKGRNTLSIRICSQCWNHVNTYALSHRFDEFCFAFRIFLFNLLVYSSYKILLFHSDLELKPVGTLEVKLVEAKELTNKDIIGKSDPFAEIFIRPLRDRMKTSKVIVRQTHIFCVHVIFA